jgi:hypothetical protein
LNYEASRSSENHDCLSGFGRRRPFACGFGIGIKRLSAVCTISPVGPFRAFCPVGPFSAICPFRTVRTVRTISAVRPIGTVSALCGFFCFCVFGPLYTLCRIRRFECFSAEWA